MRQLVPSPMNRCLAMAATRTASLLFASALLAACGRHAAVVGQRSAGRAAPDGIASPLPASHAPEPRSSSTRPASSSSNTWYTYRAANAGDGFSVDPSPNTTYVAFAFPGSVLVHVSFGRGWHMTGTGAVLLPGALAEGVPLPVNVVFGSPLGYTLEGLSLRGHSLTLTEVLAPGHTLVLLSPTGSSQSALAVHARTSASSLSAHGWHVVRRSAPTSGAASLTGTPQYGLASLRLGLAGRYALATGDKTGRLTIVSPVFDVLGICATCHTPPDKDMLNASLPVPATCTWWCKPSSHPDTRPGP